MTATETRTALLDAICAEPNDDFPRAVYADWLEEAGEELHAQHIRVALQDPTGVSRLGMSPGPPLFFYYVPAWVSYVDRRRGFVESVTCDCAAWLEHGPAFVRQEPVQRVELTDKCPLNYRVNDFWEFFKNHNWPSPFEYELPTRLALHMPCGFKGLSQNRLRYLTRSTALDALSVACLAYARAMPV